MTFVSGFSSSPVDGTILATYSWNDVEEPRGVVQIAHGLAEYSARYDRLATALNAAGYLVRAIDHRGHGLSIHLAPGDFDAPGFDGLIEDLAAYGAFLRIEHPELPLVLLAHSMGSFAAQAALLEHSDQYAAVVLSGSTALDALAAGMTAAQGPVGLEAFNAGFEHRTGYEWLTRDEAEVDLYVADPLCGFDLPAETVPSLFGPADRLIAPVGVRPDLPLLIASGTDDPLAGGGALVELLAQRYREAGLTDVTLNLYDGARHEIFNETNRDEITRDVVDWLHRRV